MANRRMFCKDITESDAFLCMPLSTQSLYFHLGMNADDDGFLGSAKKILRMIGASEDDFKLLVMKRFILIFGDGICVIKHRKMNNQIRVDRYKQTCYTKEMSSLKIKENGSYTELSTIGIPNGNQMETQYSIVEGSIVEGSIVEGSIVEDQTPPPKKTKKVNYPTIEDVEKYFQDNGYTREAARKAHKYYEAADWHNRDGKKILSRKQTMIGVRFKDENKMKVQMKTLTPEEIAERNAR